MKEKLEQVCQEALARLEKAGSVEELGVIRVA